MRLLGPIAFRCRIVEFAEEDRIRFSKHRDELVPSPDVELALFALAVGVEACAESAFRRRHIALEPGDDFARPRRAGVHCPCRDSKARAVREAAHCRRASFRNAERASARRQNSGRSRRRDDRRFRLRVMRVSVRSTRSPWRFSLSRVRARHNNSKIGVLGNFGAPPQTAVDRIDIIADLRAPANRQRRE